MSFDPVGGCRIRASHCRAPGLSTRISVHSTYPRDGTVPIEATLSERKGGIQYSAIPFVVCRRDGLLRPCEYKTRVGILTIRCALAGAIEL